MNVKMLLVAAALAAISAATYFGLEAAFPKTSGQPQMEQKTSQLPPETEPPSGRSPATPEAMQGPAGNAQTAKIVADAAARAARETAQQVAERTARDILNGGK